MGKSKKALSKITPGLFLQNMVFLPSGLQNFALLSDYHRTTDESLSVCLKINGVATANVSASPPPRARCMQFQLKAEGENKTRLETSEGTAWR